MLRMYSASISFLMVSLTITASESKKSNSHESALVACLSHGPKGVCSSCDPKKIKPATPPDTSWLQEKISTESGQCSRTLLNMESSPLKYVLIKKPYNTRSHSKDSRNFYDHYNSCEYKDTTCQKCHRLASNADLHTCGINFE